MVVVVPADKLFSALCFCIGSWVDNVSCNSFFRDLQHVIVIAMQGLFFLTPILYKHNALSGKIAWLIALNPVTPFIALFRIPLIDATLPNGSVLLQTIAISVCAMVVGLFIFLSQEKKIIFRL